MSSFIGRDQIEKNKIEKKVKILKIYKHKELKPKKGWAWTGH